MKLHQLTIENIASIEHAVIDFNAAPLANERLFLITGETGSGKSTIIDCLCLALYGNTPRMKAAKNAKYESSRNSSEKKDEQTTNNPRQLMRRGSVQASVELTFENNQGVPYIATWEVHRANGKIDGKLSPISRVLRTADGVTPAHHFSKFGDIDDHIEKIIGLDMDQFFRTVVLAQGKFAEFLNSDDKDKSELLEKMTGTGIYTQLGKKIYDTYQEKVNKCKILSGQMENIYLLDETQKAQIVDEMGQLNKQHETIKGQLQQATDMVQWLGNKARIDKSIDNNKQLLNEKLVLTGTAIHREQETLVKDWDATADARQHLKDNQKAKRHIQELDGQKVSLQQEFNLLCAALRAAIADIDIQQKKVDEMGQAIDSEAPNKAMYDAIGEIVTLFGQWREKKKNIQDYSSDLEKDEKRHPEAQKAVEDAKSKANELGTAVEKLKQQLSLFHVTEISAKLNDWNRASLALETFKAKHDLVTQAEDALAKLKAKQTDETGRLEQLTASIGEKRARKEAYQQQVDRMSDWNKLLEHARTTLHEGDTCPVCGNTITTLLAPKAESELEELRRQYKQADDDLNQTLALMKAAERLIANNEGLIKQANQDLAKRQDERAKHWNATRQLLAQCGKNADEMVDLAMADKLIMEIDSHAKQLNEQLNEASSLDAEMKAAQKRLDEAKQTLHSAELRLNTIVDSIKYQRMLIDTSKKEAKAMEQKLDDLLVKKDWKEHADDEFIAQLQTAAVTYQNMVTTKQQLSQSLEVRRTAIPAMLKHKEGIKGFDDDGSTASQAPDDLEDRWRELAGKHLQWQTQLANAEENAALSKQALDKYTALNDAVTLERLHELIAHSQEEVDAIRRAHRALNDGIIGIKSAIVTLTRQLEELNGKKPDYNEENQEKLEAIIAEKQETLESLNAQIAEKKNLLKNDEKNAVLYQDKKDLLEQAEKECKQWEQFNTMLGSSDGTKFRRIAQSYILGDLLEGANGYLRQFNNRYELEAYPGSLIILVRDLIQGDLTSVNTLSGGESFMVSLALALALSNMTGRVFSVDTIFIDEGFGSLSPNYLDNVMETLNRLYDIGGRRVGIISHVEMLKERVPTQIQVYRDPDNNTVSRVNITA
ncbi:MAG: AAA family ATPase [Muribaculaceae bacterium]|nr:AAA family ATPase [Muribaculaceae bacterium]